MILVLESTDGGRAEIALDPARGDGVAVQLEAGGYAEPLPLASLTALELDAHEVNPSLRASMGRFQRIYPLDPASVIHVGYEDPAAPILSNHQRQAGFVVSELANVTLDLDRRS